MPIIEEGLQSNNVEVFEVGLSVPAFYRIVSRKEIWYTTFVCKHYIVAYT